MFAFNTKKSLSSAVSAVIALSYLAPGYVAAQADADGEMIEEVYVTGSRIRTGRQAPSIPVDVVSADQIKLSGFQNVEEVLNNMPQFVPSRTASTNSTANPTATGAATLDLRGLGATRSLVLVNGRRYTFFDSSQTTDINSIPASLIKRVEVVTGGASAVYGSDAVAGVVNFILRDDFEGVELRSQFNQTTEGDGNVTDFTLTMGGNFADDKGNAVVAFNYLDREPIMTTDRGFSSSVLTDGNDINAILTAIVHWWLAVVALFPMVGLRVCLQAHRRLERFQEWMRHWQRRAWQVSVVMDSFLMPVVWVFGPLPVPVTCTTTL